MDICDPVLRNSITLLPLAQTIVEWFLCPLVPPCYGLNLDAYDFVSVCVFCWPPVSIPWTNYDVVGFQPQVVDISDLGSVHPPSTFPIPLTSSMHAGDKARQTKNRKWSHGIPPLLVSIWTYNICTKYPDHYLSSTRYGQQWHETNDTNYKIQGQGGWLEGIGTTVIRNSLLRWLGKGTCSPTNKHPENWPLPGSVRIRYHARASHVSLTIPKVSQTF